MPRIRRVADVAWAGNVARGNGTVSAGTGSFAALPFSLASRIADTGAADRTSPEELLAAAHAGCFGMSLASELSEAGSPPERLDVRCTVTIDEVEGAGHRVVDSTIDATARVHGIDAEAFERAASAADAGCTFSALIRASATVSINARLEEASDGD